MFLHMLSSSERHLFLKLASLFSVSGKKIESSAYSNNLVKSEDEEKALNRFRLECEVEEDEYEDDLCQEQKFLESLEALPKSSLNSQLIRKEICAGLLKDIMEEENISLSASGKKIFIFELMAFGLASGGVGEIEKHLLDAFALEVGVDSDTYEEVQEHCRKVNDEVRKALLLIME